MPATPIEIHRSEIAWQLPAEGITVRIRWFGLCVGYVYVNLLAPSANQPQLNAILTLGAVYALLDTLWGVRGKVFLREAPLFISLMEAVFIGLLCWFDQGLDSPFRFYYFLSLLVCAIRYSPVVTYSTFAFHSVSYSVLAVQRGVGDQQDLLSYFLMLVFMGWVTWASTALSALLKAAGMQLSILNRELQDNQLLLERRIDERTRELQQSQALLVQQEKQAAFGLLAAGIAHEVGNPLAAISSVVQLMNRKPLEPEMHDRLGLIDEQLRRIQRTLRELVDFSRPAVKEATTCDVHDVIQSALDVAKYYKRMKGKAIETRFSEFRPLAHVVRDQLQQVFLNLILNALDATEEGGTLTLETRCEGEVLQIDIIDDGSGVPADKQSQLFEAYFTTKVTGTGLGLFVCRSLMQQARGNIRLVESAPGRTVFRVQLPTV
ncbi:MAG: two-component sensor histidine kinase [Planctomyces sp.]|nr:two-component sensor histidine kinase [Planctomyces sp.]